MASYRPDNYDPTNKSVARKRRWAGDNNPRKRGRSKSPRRHDHGLNDKEHQTADARRPRPYREYEQYNVSKPYNEQEGYGSSQTAEQPDNELDHADHEVMSNSNRKTKTKKDRKENPSSRIHSLRRLIARGQLPPPVQLEKERELAALLHEREQTELRKTRRTNLERYHFIRFMERQKAQRVLKKLKKQKMSGVKLGDDGRGIDTKIQDAEIDLNYTLYAPLAEKYISIFAEHDRNGNPINKVQKYKHNWKLNPQDEMKPLDRVQRDALQMESMEAANVYEMNVNPSNSPSENENVPKPPAWYEVKEAMEGGESKLNALRDRQRPSSSRENRLVIGLRASGKGNMDWLHDNGKIDPKDLDTDSDNRSDFNQDMGDGGAKVDAAHVDAIDYDDDHDNDNEDEDMSDGDGGFFEKR